MKDRTETLLAHWSPEHLQDKDKSPSRPNMTRKSEQDTLIKGGPEEDWSLRERLSFRTCWAEGRGAPPETSPGSAAHTRAHTCTSSHTYTHIHIHSLTHTHADTQGAFSPLWLSWRHHALQHHVLNELVIGIQRMDR